MEVQTNRPSSNARIVDVHVHLLPGRLGEKVREYFAPFGRDLAYPAAHDAVRVQLEAEGVDEIWTLPYAHKPGVASWLNRETALIAARPGCLTVIPGATAHPGDDDPAAIVRHAVEELGARVLKLHCSVGDFRADDSRLDQMWHYAAAVRLPVVVHVGHDSNGQTDDRELGSIHAVADRHPDARVVVAHCGYPSVDSTLNLIERHSNVYADLTPVMHAAPQVPSERLDALAARLLFGSDAPNATITAADRLAHLRSLPIDAATVDSICGHNATRLRIGVEPAQQMPASDGV